MDHLLRETNSGPPSLADFIEATLPIQLEKWQQCVCARLQKLPYQTGQRILIHAPPQHGKSIIVSQRFPAWLLGIDPYNRIKLACYNITHATEFSKVVIDVMRSDEYAALFPSEESRIPRRYQEEAWTTVGRKAKHKDGQPSFKALGLRTGFVGQGVDTLIIDDPYASPQEALSETIRESVWTFWTAGAEVRLNDASNVVVMFHRYHGDDLAGKLIAQGGWEVMRFAAIADENEAMPDPMGRKPGEKLSQRYSDGFYANIQKAMSIWLGQFQGIPLPPGGGMLKRNWFRTINPEHVPPLLITLFGVDLAVSKKTTADYTVGFPFGVDSNNNYYLFRPARGQWEPAHARKELITRIQQFPTARRIGMESVAALSGYVTEMRAEKAMAGYSVIDIGRHTDKVLLCSGWSPIAEQGRVFLVDDGSGWTEIFLQETDGFPLGHNDDQVDAVGICFETLHAKVQAPGHVVNPVELIAGISSGRG